VTCVRRKVLAAPPLLSVAALLSVATLPEACSTKKPSPSADEPPPPVIATPSPVPPVAFSGAPVSSFADAGNIDGKTAYEQAHAYEAGGQYWLARLVLEKKAFGEDGTNAEIELLARICHQQGDDACVEGCGKRLGKKLKFDGGAPRTPLPSGEHKEPETDAARARDHLLKHRLKEAREILEPKVIDGKASKEELRLLKSVCKEQGDRMCVALCDAKLK